MEAISRQSYLFIQDWIQRESGLHLEGDKTYLLEARLEPVVQEEGLGNFENLCLKLRAGSVKLARRVVEAMATHETLFFRDRAPFDALQMQILPDLLLKARQGRKLSFWSAAASSGQEAYSIAMLLLEAGLSVHQASVLGSDLSNAVIDRARAGTYGNFEVNRGLSRDLLLRYFEECGSNWKVQDRVRRLVDFECRDLRRLPVRAELFDVVFCRNVTIYFDTETKNQVLREIRARMVQGGCLFLGAAENASALTDLYERKVMQGATVYIAR